MKNFRLLTSILFTIIFLLTLNVQSFSQQFKALLFTKTDGFHHESINEGVIELRKLALKHNFAIEWHVNAEVFNDKELSEFDVIIFLSTSGNILNDEQKIAMTKFIQAGKGFVGIHGASTTEYKWDWYTKLVGRSFHVHPQIQTAELEVINRKFPGLERMPDNFWWTDEWYEFGAEKTDNLNYILSVNETTYSTNTQWGEKIGNGMGDFHPIAWFHNYDGGRSFYSALGHLPATYGDILFQEHIYGGIYWAATGKGLKQ